jgi:hypothetical protein
MPMPLRVYRRFRAGKGIQKVAREVGVGIGTVQRIAQDMDRPFESRRSSARFNQAGVV